MEGTIADMVEALKKHAATVHVYLCIRNRLLEGLSHVPCIGSFFHQEDPYEMIYEYVSESSDQ